MLVWITAELSHYYRVFSVFEYTTLRAVLATLTALILTLVVGAPMIRWLAQYKVGQVVRNDGPKTHFSKAGTPTMGGAMILFAITLTTLLWSDLKNPYVWIVLIVTLGFGAIGWVDDYRKMIRQNPKGLSARWKYFWQSVIGLLAALYLYSKAVTPAETSLLIPFLKNVMIPLGISLNNT